MSEIARLYKYRELLGSRRAMSASELIAKQEISAATFKRDMAKLRDQFGLPIVFDRELRGYRLEKTDDRAELPGLWFSADEMLALLGMQQMLTELAPGWLGSKLKPLEARLRALLARHGVQAEQLPQRIRISQARKRRMPPTNFEVIAAATLARKQLHIGHRNRESGELIARTVSPQHVVHYRDNWYLQAWCHLRKALRSFALDAIESCELTDSPAQEVDSETLHRELQGSYGIFGGQPTAWASLRFAADVAPLVAREQWHPDQKGHMEPDGSYVLQVPYSDERELVRDVLRYGDEVEVLGPESLRLAVSKTLRAALKPRVS